MRRAEGGRGPARLTRRMPRLHFHRAPGGMNEFSPGEPVARAELPAAAELSAAAELPAAALEPAIQSPELLVRPPEPPVRRSNLRRLFTNFGYLVAKQGATAV